jgi:hypothetical protein
MWELEDKYKDIKSRAEWAFNITFVSVILGAGYAAWTIRYGEAHPLHIRPIWIQFGYTYSTSTNTHNPIRRYRYTDAVFPFPYKNVLKYRTRQNLGGISILVFNTK